MRIDSVCGIVPAYNAEETVADVVRVALHHLPSVIVADDGSIDGTALAASEAGAEVIRIPENRGKGNALRVLFAEAKRRGFASAVALDADGQHDPEDIPRFLESRRDHPDAIIVGSRMGEAGAIPSHRFNSMVVARFYVCLAANRYIDDTQCGFRLYPLRVLESIGLRKERYVTETELLIKAGDSGTPVRSIPIRAVYRPGQKTHFRSVPDVAAISVYVISYLMVKWAIEAFRPGVKYTYRGAGKGRDRFGPSPRVDRAFEILTLLAAMPLSALYGLSYYLLRRVGIRSFEGLRQCGISVGNVFLSTMFLPLLLVVSIMDLTGNRIGFHPDLTTKFVRNLYPNLWRD